MKPETQKKWDRATRLITAATGEEYGDGEVVTNIGQGFSEPGYSGDVWVTGNWNPARFNREVPLTNEESLPERLGNALDKQGVEILWLDEWADCHSCFKAVRTQPDSYSWTPSYYSTEDGELFCHECSEFFDIEEKAVNNSNYAVPSFFDLEEEGFELYNAESYQAGWHEGQDADPAAILKEALKAGWDEVVFYFKGKGQFDMDFDAYVRKVE
jgi:hypothetical protein